MTSLSSLWCGGGRLAGRAQRGPSTSDASGFRVGRRAPILLVGVLEKRALYVRRAGRRDAISVASWLFSRGDWRYRSKTLERVSRFVWLMAGRDGAAFTRLAWREACRLMDVPLIWKAIEAVEAELFSGLLRLEPADPRPGDLVQFVMPGAQAEAAASPAFIEFTGERKRRPRRDIAQARRPI